MVVSTSYKLEEIKRIVYAVQDPEVPVLTIQDLGIVRDVVYTPPLEGQGEVVEIIITPTYSGCPAMDMISMNIRLALIEHGYKNVKITSVLSPAWTTDWMTEEGKRKLKEYGIAPPMYKVSDASKASDAYEQQQTPLCPQCNSNNTKLLSEFGSTACKALYQCQDCKEPFDYFKCH
jgi:ring-1,2-phenylacetyl-CoA epoxidase subunit PaaD